MFDDQAIFYAEKYWISELRVFVPMVTLVTMFEKGNTFRIFSFCIYVYTALSIIFCIGLWSHRFGLSICANDIFSRFFLICFHLIRDSPITLRSQMPAAKFSSSVVLILFLLLDFKCWAKNGTELRRLLS